MHTSSSVHNAANYTQLTHLVKLMQQMDRPVRNVTSIRTCTKKLCYRPRTLVTSTQTKITLTIYALQRNEITFTHYKVHLHLAASAIQRFHWRRNWKRFHLLVLPSTEFLFLNCSSACSWYTSFPNTAASSLMFQLSLMFMFLHWNPPVRQLQLSVLAESAGIACLFRQTCLSLFDHHRRTWVFRAHCRLPPASLLHHSTFAGICSQPQRNLQFFYVHKSRFSVNLLGDWTWILLSRWLHAGDSGSCVAWALWFFPDRECGIGTMGSKLFWG